MSGAGIPKNATVTKHGLPTDFAEPKMGSKPKTAKSGIPANPTVTTNGLPSDFRQPRAGAVRGV